MRKVISILTPCYNEELNIRNCYEAVRTLFENDLKEYDYEHIFSDNASTDKTVDILKEIAAKDLRVKIIINSRNFGPFRSAFNCLLNARGDAVVVFLAADLQDPPGLILEFIKKWQEGYKVVYGVRSKREEVFVMAWIRKLYYRVVNRLSEIHIPADAGEFQLIDRTVVEALRQFSDYYPYIRGMIASCGFESTGIPYTWQGRKKGASKNRIYHLVDQGMNGIISFTQVPLRLCMLLGFALAILSITTALVHLILNVVFYGQLAAPGIPTLIVALFFFSGVQLFFLGLLGEYIGAIHFQVRKRPLVIERERINFNDSPEE